MGAQTTTPEFVLVEQYSGGGRVPLVGAEPLFGRDDATDTSAAASRMSIFAQVMGRPRRASPLGGLACNERNRPTEGGIAKLSASLPAARGSADVGADQFSAAPVRRRPLTPADVGPNSP